METGMETRLHPAAVSATTDEARRVRTEEELRAARAPGEFRAAFRAVLEAPPSPERSDALMRAYKLGYDAFGRHDWELNTLVMHPTDYVFTSGDLSQILPGMPKEFRGPEGYIRANEELWFGVWSDVRIEVEEVLDAGPGRLVGLTVMQLQGGASSLEIVQPWADVHTFRDGWLVRQEFWWDRPAGLRAAGLPPRA